MNMMYENTKIFQTHKEQFVSERKIKSSEITEATARKY